MNLKSCRQERWKILFFCEVICKIVKTSWNVSWLNYNMKHAQTLLKLLHRVIWTKIKDVTDEKIQQIKNDRLSVQEFTQYWHSIFQSLSVLINYKQCSLQITKDIITLCSFIRFWKNQRFHSHTEKPDVRNRTRMLTDRSNGEVHR